MHEFSLIADLLRKIESIAAENGGGPVIRVKVRLGALSHISPEHFRGHFVEFTKGTVAANAVLDISHSDDTNDPTAQDIILESVDLGEDS